jgi:hypothetical protein
MVDPKQKFKARSRGRSGKQRPLLKNFTLYLDESFDCGEVKALLDAGSIKYKIYSSRFDKGTDDTHILRLAGQKGWVMLTCDKKNRYRELECKAVHYYRVRQFVFAGNLGGIPLARLLVSIKNKMRQFCRDHERPFVATITQGGSIHLRMDKNGNLHGREKS